MKTEQLIEAYFLNKLSADEVEELKKRLQGDSTAKADFIFQLELSKVLQENEKKKIKQRLQLLDQQSDSSKVKWWAVAASIAVLFAMAWALGLFTNTAQNDQLYATYFQPYPNVIAPLERSSNNRLSEFQKEAFQLYDQQEYEKASLAFQDLYKKEQEDYALFYLIVSTMGNKDYDKAIELFKQKEQWEASDFEFPAKWYAALAHLKLKDKKEAVSLLNEIKMSDHTLSKSAEKLLAELN